jgi:hypothetical protein
MVKTRALSALILFLSRVKRFLARNARSTVPVWPIENSADIQTEMTFHAPKSCKTRIALSSASRVAVALCAAVLLLSACGFSRRILTVHPEALSIDAGVPGRYLSLAADGQTLVGVFSDRRTTTLKMIQLPLGEHLPPVAPAAAVIDRVDATPPLSSTFGEHVLSLSDGVLRVLYEERKADDKLVLKLASKAADAPQWTLDVLEPAGDPVAVLPGDSGSLAVFWAAGSLYARILPADDQPVTLRDPFLLGSPASVFGESGFTAYDGASRSLLAIRATGDGFESRVVQDASPVHASLLGSDGLLAVLTWDAGTRRLVLLEQDQPDAKPARTTVTLCDGTGTVAVLPARGHRAYLMLFDETRRLGAGRTVHELSLIAPGSSLGAPGSRYRKAVLLSGEQPIQGFAAIEAQGALYVLAQQGGLTLLRLGLSHGQ